MDRRVLIYVPCHRQEVAERAPKGSITMLDPRWWELRADVFRRLVLPSLDAQTCQDFDVVLTVRDVDNNGDNQLLRVAEEAGCKTCVRPYEPYRYSVAPNQYSWFIDKYGGKVDWLVVAQLDSDDMYARDVVQMLYDMPLRDGTVFYFDVGYAYGFHDHRLCRYGIRHFPGPFYGWVCGPKALQSVDAFTAYRREWQQEIFHYEAPKCPRPRRMPENKCMQVMHLTNASSGWRDKHTRKRISEWIEDEEERQAILAEFGFMP